MAIKSDMEKNYNRLDWTFVKKCFIDLGLLKMDQLDHGLYNHNFYGYVH